MKRLALVVAVLAVALPAHANLILNGNFENNTAVGCDSNLSNANFTAKMANATGFGTAGEIDIYTGGLACFGPLPAQSGQTKIAIHNQGAAQNALADAFSFDLSSQVIAGNMYDLKFWAHTVLQFDPDIGPVQVGLSNSANSFGTLVFTSGLPSTQAWAQFSTSIVAPISASFLTVRNQAGFDVWNHVDNFSLVQQAPLPGTLYLCLMGLGAVLSRRRLR